jgi:hypothetical protein
MGKRLSRLEASVDLTLDTVEATQDVVDTLLKFVVQQSERADSMEKDIRDIKNQLRRP